MQTLNVETDQVTLTVALSACADLGALEMGEWIHTYVRRKPELEADLSLNNAFINMYAKCGEVQTARKLFDSLGEKDVTTWTSMIVGHALHGQASEALELFGEMEEIKQKNSKNKEEGNCGSSIILPNDVTFIGVLMACSHGGMVEKGKEYYQSMIEDYGLKPRDLHFGCMVDLFCRAGLLKEAYHFITEMPGLDNAVLWRTLLGACSINGEIELGEKVKLQLLELEPGYVGDNVAMSNIYAAKGMWDKKVKVRDQIKQLRRAPGCSSIEVASEISEFVSVDDDHPLKDEIYEALNYLTVSMKTYDYSLRISILSEF
ncbi:putative pentatricopeptide repeat-containing protein [Hibiscus syriacus]|uniref:Pentatricopeptide repeat-containing protein n=2 Tax=Hibiscus syriacus TaxID=106335 RepID=A0A6A3D3S2_HIBSY|nr:putative pentatricopeptide repeat-containing protein [Hibiscus syriacus]